MNLLLLRVCLLMVGWKLVRVIGLLHVRWVELIAPNIVALLMVVNRHGRLIIKLVKR